MNSMKTKPGGWEANTAKNTAQLRNWTAAWVLTMALANFGPKFIWEMNTTISSLVILLNMAIGFGMILANKRHLNGLDELHQKVQLEAAHVLPVARIGGAEQPGRDRIAIHHDRDLPPFRPSLDVPTSTIGAILTRSAVTGSAARVAFDVPGRSHGSFR